MNKTTFTIESVHGVKQTIVLLPTIRIATGNESQDSGGHVEASQASGTSTVPAARQ